MHTPHDRVSHLCDARHWPRTVVHPAAFRGLWPLRCVRSFSFRLGGGNGGCMSAPSLPLHVSSAPRSLASPLRPVGRETWWTLPCASCRVPSTRGVFSRTLLWKTGALALSSSFTRGKGRYGHLGVDAGFICTSGPFPYRSSFLPARSTHLRPFGRVTRQTFPSALGLGTVCLALVPLALPRTTDERAMRRAVLAHTPTLSFSCFF